MLVANSVISLYRRYIYMIQFLHRYFSSCQSFALSISYFSLFSFTSQVCVRKLYQSFIGSLSLSISISILIEGFQNLSEKTDWSFTVALLSSFGVFFHLLTAAPDETHCWEQTDRRQSIKIKQLFSLAQIRVILQLELSICIITVDVMLPLKRSRQRQIYRQHQKAQCHNPHLIKYGL